MGTLRVQMTYIWVQMSIFVSKLCPPNSRGDLRGLCPRNRHLLPPMGKCLREIRIVEVSFATRYRLKFHWASLKSEKITQEFC